MTLIDRLSEYACSLRFEDLPECVVSKANDALFDLIGCYYGALDDINARKVLFTTRINGNEATLWGTGLRSSSDEVAMTGGFLGYSLEYDDGTSLGGHWGSASIPAFIATAEKYGKNGKDLILAICLGYGIGTRISRIYSSTLLRNKVHFPCAMGFYSAASGTGKLMGLDSDAFAAGLANGALSPVGPYATAVGGGSIKSMYSGWPNFLAIRMMELAKNGIGGTTDVFEAPDGLGVIYKGHPLTEEEFSNATDSLGKSFLLMESYFKPYPCCRWLHAPLYLLKKTLEKNSEKKIERIVVSGPSFLSLYDTHGDYTQIVKAQYSIPYTMGAMLLHHDCGIAEFEDSFRVSREISETSRKIEVVVDDELNARFPNSFAVKNTVYFSDGTVESEQGILPWGPEQPAKKEELIDKFRKLTKNVISEDMQNRFIEIYLNGIEREGAFEKLITLLSMKVI